MSKRNNPNINLVAATVNARQAIVNAIVEREKLSEKEAYQYLKDTGFVEILNGILLELSETMDADLGAHYKEGNVIYLNKI